MTSRQTRIEERNALFRLRAAVRHGDGVLVASVPGIDHYEHAQRRYHEARRLSQRLWDADHFDHHERILNAHLMARDLMRASAVIMGIGIAVLLVGEQLMSGAVLLVSLLPGIMAATAGYARHREAALLNDRVEAAVASLQALDAWRIWTLRARRLLTCLQRRIWSPVELFAQVSRAKTHRLTNRERYAAFEHAGAPLNSAIERLIDGFDQLSWAQSMLIRYAESETSPKRLHAGKMLHITMAICSVMAVSIAAWAAYLATAQTSYALSTYHIGVWGFLSSLFALLAYFAQQRDVKRRQRFFSRIGAVDTQRQAFGAFDDAMKSLMNQVTDEYRSWPCVDVRPGIPLETLVAAELESRIVALLPRRAIQLHDANAIADSLPS